MFPNSTDNYIEGWNLLVFEAYLLSYNLDQRIYILNTIYYTDYRVFQKKAYTVQWPNCKNFEEKVIFASRFSLGEAIFKYNIM